MAMVVRSNLMAYNANRQLGMNNSAVSKNLEKLSSGFKINRAADDAAGLAISEKMKAQIKGLETASSNSQDGISLVQTAEGALTEVHDMLNRMTELATKSANGTIKDEVDREAIQNEVNKLNDEIDRISESTNFNGINLLDGSLSNGGAAGGPKGVPAIKDLNLDDVDATKGEFTATTVTGAAKDMTEGQNMTYSFTYKDAAGKTSTIDISFTIEKDAAGALKVLKAADGTTYACTDKKPSAKEIGDVLVDQLGKSALKDTFKATNANGVLKFEAKKAGSAANAGEMISIKEKQTMATDAPTDVTLGVKADATKGTDAFQEIEMGTFKSGDVFTVGGKKFAFVDTKEALAALDSDVHGVITAVKDTVDNDELTEMAKLIKQTTGYEPTVDNTKLQFKAPTGTDAKGGGLTLQIGDTGEEFNQVTVSVDNMSSKGIGTQGLDVSSQSSAKASIQTIKDAINKVSTNRSEMGALQNRLEHTINNLDVAAENMTNANSRIRDTDMAKQMMEYTKMNVLTQSAQAMLAQANQNPQSILQLLQ